MSRGGEGKKTNENSSNAAGGLFFGLCREGRNSAFFHWRAREKGGIEVQRNRRRMRVAPTKEGTRGPVWKDDLYTSVSGRKKGCFVHEGSKCQRNLNIEHLRWRASSGFKTMGGSNPKTTELAMSGGGKQR